MTTPDNIFSANVLGDGDTPLHCAAMRGHFNICKFILENVGDKNPANNMGDTPLHYAAKTGQLKVCQLIISHLACQVNKNPRNNYGDTPYHQARTDLSTWTRASLKMYKMFEQMRTVLEPV